MADFQARLWLAEDPASAIDADITLSDDCLVVSAAGQTIGDWKRTDVIATAAESS